MESEPIFEFESDWVEYFDGILKNETREDTGIRNDIKANIVESNQTIETFLKRNPEIIHIPSKEDFFHNLKIKHNNKDHYFYLDNSDKRFWIVHNVERSEIVNSIIERLTSDDYLQDKIYLSNDSITGFQKKFQATSMGFTLKFNQLFSSESSAPVFKSEVEAFEDIGFTMTLWPKRKKAIDFFIEQFDKIHCPINYAALNFIFEDENKELLIKENLYDDGSFTIDKGKNIRKHLSFIDGVRDDYGQKMIEVEENRLDWEKMKGGLYTIEFQKEINPKNFINAINQAREQGRNPFKINAFFMYTEGESSMYTCIDTHTGGKFFLQAFPDRLIINLEKESCGNIIFRLYSNLKRYFSIKLDLRIDDQKFLI